VSKQSLNLGRSGETIAVDFLRKNGYKILNKNYKTKLGEIDIIAQDKGVICVVEVKARHSDKFGLPQEAVFFHKQRQIAKAALNFLKEKKLLEKKARFDVVAIIFSNGEPKIELVKNAFELDDTFTL
jgi:putative endonuclease